MKKCFICNDFALFTIGIAIGFSGNDYNFCKKCLHEITLKELLDKIQKEENDKGLD